MSTTAAAFSFESITMVTAVPSHPRSFLSRSFGYGNPSSVNHVRKVHLAPGKEPNDVIPDKVKERAQAQSKTFGNEQD